MKNVLIPVLLLALILAGCSSRYSEDQLKTAEGLVLNGILITPQGAREPLNKGLQTIIELQNAKPYKVKSVGTKHETYGPGIIVMISWKGNAGLMQNADWLLTEKGGVHPISMFAQGLGILKVDPKAIKELFAKK